MATQAYTIGQIMAVLERAGTATEQSVRQVSTVPATLNTLLALAPSRVKGRLGERLEDLIDAIATVPTGPFVAAQQGDYWLGYHHERARMRGGRPPAPKSERAATLTARMEVLMTPDLKEWAIAHGGSELLRSLLQAERDRTP